MLFMPKDHLEDSIETRKRSLSYMVGLSLCLLASRWRNLDIHQRRQPRASFDLGDYPALAFCSYLCLVDKAERGDRQRMATVTAGPSVAGGDSKR